MQILITGSSGHLAQILIPKLLAHPEITHIYGIDKKPSLFNHIKYTHYQIDILDHFAILSKLPLIDVFIHMAFILMGGGLGKQRFNRALIQKINREASQNWISFAIKQGIKKIIFISSAAIYGFQKNQPIPENAPLTPIPGFHYGEDKAFIEQWIDTLSTQSFIIRLRFPAILGPHSQDIFKALLKQPFYPKTSTNPAKFSFIWEEDATYAIINAIFKPISGAFNIAYNQPLSFHEILKIHNVITLPLPQIFLETLHPLLWLITPQIGEPGWIKGLKQDLILDTQKAYTILGWQAHYNCFEAIKNL